MAAIKQLTYMGGLLLGTAMPSIPALSLTTRSVLLALSAALILFLSKRKRIGATATSLGLALVMSLFAYFDYLVGNRVFIFLDIASDTGVQFWPMMAYLSRNIWSGQLPMWSFEIGLGLNVFPSWLTDPFATLGILAGESVLPYTLGPLQVLKILLAIVCLDRYFKLLGYSQTARIVGALSIAFCGHMVSRGTWYEYATEVAVISFYLYALERFVQSGRFLLLALGTCLAGCPGAYYAYLYFILLTMFALVRIFFLGGRLFAAPGAVMGRWVAVSTVGVLLVGVFLLPDVVMTLRSTRASGDSEMISEVFAEHSRTPFLLTEDNIVLLTALARQMSPNLLGGANRFTGIWNYLEAPLAYVGLLPLLCVLPCFLACTGRQRLVLAGFLVAAIAYHYLVYFRQVIDAFAGSLFKISNLWVAIGLGLCGAKALDSIERRGKSPRIGIGISLAVSFSVLAVVALRASSYEMIVDRRLLWICAAVSLAYAISLLLVGWGHLGELPFYGMLAIVVFELTFSAYESVSVHRGALDGKAPRAHAGYDDAALNTIRKIRRNDPSTYRIERDKSSVSEMDALMQDYYGTRAYVPFKNPVLVKFLWEVGALEKNQGAPTHIKGLGARGALLPLFGVKYYLSESGASPSGYVKQFQDDKIAIFSHSETSFGFFYTRTISRSEFDQLGTPMEKQAALLQAAVLESPSKLTPTLRPEDLRAYLATALPECNDKESCLVPTRVQDEFANLTATPVRFTKFANSEVRGSVSAPQPGVLFLSIPFDSGWRLFVDGQRREPQRANVGFIGIELPPGEHEFNLRYWTPGLLPGALLTAAGLLGLAGGILVPAWRRRRSARCDA